MQRSHKLGHFLEQGNSLKQKQQKIDHIPAKKHMLPPSTVHAVRYNKAEADKNLKLVQFTSRIFNRINLRGYPKSLFL